MPIYEYQCRACGERLEALQKLSEAPLTECPHCGKPALRKLVSAAGFRLKGGGWYETDFKSGHRHNVLDSGDKPAAEDKEKKPADTATAKSDKPKTDKSKVNKKPETKKAASSASS
ncbi:MAG: zinc ribbon domain-containing protein [Gammaproteobacteria bacterium]|nr:zinc ribbon domain-containing protein [Gammaproteobacteria bacterium]MBU6509890.1 zinc ribbon domain-containing protein [Gammaproteobacteria bacterium]MDE1984295.1 zinc ribbon domain-containing protein [Gammaproteobacteria bacterium]MDE2109266.1 zinc ribbon domain-containing protein [Gammaproteobacteria bacterium]MDE2461737.1 zinc ribbon domain-containing protein [Gammaproteobacteria bacterium]